MTIERSLAVRVVLQDRYDEDAFLVAEANFRRLPRHLAAGAHFGDPKVAGIQITRTRTRRSTSDRKYAEQAAQG